MSKTKSEEKAAAQARDRAAAAAMIHERRTLPTDETITRLKGIADGLRISKPDNDGLQTVTFLGIKTRPARLRDALANWANEARREARSA